MAGPVWWASPHPGVCVCVCVRSFVRYCILTPYLPVHPVKMDDIRSGPVPKDRSHPHRSNSLF